MKSIQLAAAGIALLIAGCRTGSPTVAMNVVADYDRDGAITLHDSDLSLKTMATPVVYVLSNNDSDQDSGATDSSDEKVNGPADLEDMTQIVIPRVPGIEDWQGAMTLTPPAAAKKFRFFQKQGEVFIPLPQEATLPLSAKDLAAGEIILRVEATSYAGPDWNGAATLTISAERSEPPSTLSTAINLQVSPFIMLSNLAPVKDVYVREHPNRNEAFIASLRDITAKAGANLVVVPAGEPYASNNIWLQDTMEVGYSEIPGRRMNVVMRANRNKSLDEFPKRDLLGPDYGWIQVGEYRPDYGAGEGGNSWIDWYGNLEVTPPIKGFPMGRIYYGVNGDASLNPDVVAMLNAQGVQSPALPLDVGWLLIRHVDEMLCFVPSGDSARPYRLIVPSFDEFHALLKDLEAKGHGNLPIFDRFHGYWEKNYTVSNLLANKELMDHNLKLEAERIKPMIEAALAGFGMTAEDLVPIPALHNVDGSAICPNMVNALVVNGHLVMSDPNGPLIDGKDPIQTRTVEILTAAGVALTPHFVDDRQYHKWSGNVHCGTNTRREGMELPWWSYDRPAEQ
jgi:protein-arginine deiminase